MDGNLKIREIYESVNFPAAIIDSNCYVVWANALAQKEPNGMFEPSGIRDILRFTDERAFVRRLVKNGMGATVSPRQLSSYGLQLTFTPLPEIGKEMLVTLSKGVKTAAMEAGVNNAVSCSVPAVREITARVCDSVELIKCSDRKEREEAIKAAKNSCSELVGAMDRMSLLADLLAGVKINITKGNTEEYFSYLAQGINELLGENAPVIKQNITQKMNIDHELVGKVLLMLIANALEHGNGDTAAEIFVTDGKLVIETSNSISREGAIKGEYAMRPYVSFTGSGKQNERAGLGLSIAAQVAKQHGGSLDVSSLPEYFAVRFEIPNREQSKYIDFPETKSCVSYISDSFSPLYTELVKFAPKGKGGKK